MNILLLTTSMIDSDFANFQDKAKIKPNPSNQNFYSKLIKALSINNNLAVVSTRPFRKGMFKNHFFNAEIKSDNNISYYYTRTKDGKFYKLFNQSKDILKSAKEAISTFDSNDFVIITDTLKYNLLRVALKLGNTYGIKVVGMLTDNPHNLSFAKKSYASNLVSKIKKCDAYLSLTRKLADIITTEKPSYVFEGLVLEEHSNKKDPISNYFFFGGSLYERYGVKKLVDAFHNSKCKSKLIIAGNGPLSKYIEKTALEDYRILFLSQISKEKVISYELNSNANINPRPLDKKIDNESIPSKLLEYLSTGVPVISTKHPKFYNVFTDDIYWIENNDQKAITEALEKFEQLSKEETQIKGETAKRKVFEFYSLNVQGESITHFLKKLS